MTIITRPFRGQRRKSRRKTKAQPRKNRPYQDCRRMNMDCCKEQNCLSNQGIAIILIIRRDFDTKLYEEQNNFLNSFIDVELKLRRSRITYNIRDVSGLRKIQICKTAFMKIFGIGRKRIDVFLRKKKPFSGDIEEDRRRKFSRNQKKLPLSVKAEVFIKVICGEI